MADEDKPTEDELVVVEVDEDGQPPVPDAGGEGADGGKKPADKVAAPEEDDHDEDDEDERLATSQDDSDAEISEASKKRKKRRLMQKQARERAEAERLALLEQNRRLMERVERLEGVTTGQAVNTIDSRIEKTKNDIRTAERIMAQAMTAGNADDHVTALRIRDEARDELRELENVKKTVSSQSEAAPKPGEVNPAVANMAAQWAQANAQWFNPNGGDPASQRALQIDAEMTRDKIFDPSTRAYWVELTRRVNAAIAEIEDDDVDDTPAPKNGGERKGPPLGSGRGNAPVTKKNEVYVTPARKQAMQEAGVWDDPVLRQQYLKAYKEYDRDHAASR